MTGRIHTHQDLEAIIPLDRELFDIITCGKVDLTIQFWSLRKNLKIQNRENNNRKQCGHCLCIQIKSKNNAKFLPPQLLSPCRTSNFDLSGQTSVSSTKRKKMAFKAFHEYNMKLFCTQRGVDVHLILRIKTNYHSIFIQLCHPSFFEVQQIGLQLRQIRVIRYDMMLLLWVIKNNKRKLSYPLWFPNKCWLHYLKKYSVELCHNEMKVIFFKKMLRILSWHIPNCNALMHICLHLGHYLSSRSESADN